MGKKYQYTGTKIRPLVKDVNIKQYLTDQPINYMYTTIDEIAALWTLNQLSKETLPSIASNMIALGSANDIIYDLAASRNSNVERNSYSLSLFLAEYYGRVLSTNEAVDIMVRVICNDILSGRIAPFWGARRIWSELWDSNRQRVDLAVFAGLASECIDQEKYRKDYENDIVSAARNAIDGLDKCF